MNQIQQLRENQDVQDLLADVRGQMTFDIVNQLTERRLCFLCLSSCAQSHEVEDGDDTSEVYVCDLCIQKIKLYSCNVSRWLEPLPKQDSA